MTKLGRRSLIRMVGAGLGAGALAQVGGKARAADPREPPKAPAATGPRAVPWTYKPLDPDVTAERAYAGYQ